jgi:hypothetical protein
MVCFQLFALAPYLTGEWFQAAHSSAAKFHWGLPMAVEHQRLRKWTRPFIPKRGPGRVLRLVRYRGAVPKQRRLGVIRRLCEQAALYLLNGLHPGEYYLYGLEDSLVSWNHKKAFLSEERAPSYWDALAPQRYRVLLANKLVAHRLLWGWGLPVPRLYGVFDPVCGRTESGAPLRSADDLRRWATVGPVAEFVLKPIESGEGHLVLPLTRNGELLEAPNGVKYSWDGLVEFMTDAKNLRRAYPIRPEPPATFLLQERLRRHESLSSFATETVCSVRVLTLLNMAGNVEIVAATFKLPNLDRGVDNLAQGGMAVSVDLGTGVLGEGVLYRTLPPRRFRAPLGGTREFVGFRLPFWDEVLDLAKQAARAFSFVRAIGWDIALSKAGPFILEGNDTWSVPMLQQSSGRGLAQGALKEAFLKLRTAKFRRG